MLVASSQRRNVKRFSSGRASLIRVKNFSRFGSMKLLHTCAKESSVHGLPHLVAKDRHWLERLLWAVILVCSVYGSYAICLITWTRYQQNPTVLTLQTDWRQWIYRPPAITFCPMYFDVQRSKDMIQRLWNISEQHEKFPFYYRFLETVANATTDNLATFEPFAADDSLANVDMLEVAWNVRHLNFTSSIFRPVITENGICLSSSNLSYLQSVSNTIKYNNRKLPQSCYSFDLCKSTFVNTEDEIASATDAIRTVMQPTKLAEIIIFVEQIVASPNLKHLSPARRKCVYRHESSSIFKIHTPNLCKIDCRIQNALKMCGCIPFFYSIPNISKCNVEGMLCLYNHKQEWYHSACHCMEQCESTKFTMKSAKVTAFPQASRHISVEMVFPKRRIKRSVLFSLSDLVVSFGGAAALFLGCSFLSAVEFIYFFLEYAGMALGGAIGKLMNREN
ncbi:sodium channel protein Nach isoform X2 [Wyeomyia smithii]|uniref:sodium channel protein Nach isoform X2 n=1 Tax=Wyeomyia smithii TaxID=174621 RepID=UPI002467DC23|nr:sodium channel protein Nach isoform X2 [Wyeomyia smithii]